MVETILVSSLISMFHFTGNIPRPFADSVADRIELNRMLQRADEKYVPNEIRLLGGNVILIVNTITTQTINWRTEF